MNASEIWSDIDFLCGSTSGTYYQSHKARNVNQEYQRLATVIWQADGTWNFDDQNNTDTAVAYRTVANASATYTIPTTALRVRQVEIKDGAGDWSVLRPITYEEIGISPEEYMTGGGKPEYYLLDGTQIRLFPAPATDFVTMSSGMAVRLDRAVTPIGASATTTVPGFAAPYHKLLSYAATLEFVRDNQDREFFMQQKDRLEKGLMRFYSGRSDDHPNRIRAHNANPSRRYI